MNSTFRKYFLNYETYFICNIEKIESCQKYYFNKAEIAISRNTVEQNENLVVNK